MKKLSQQNIEKFIKELLDEFIKCYTNNKLEYIGISLIEKVNDNDLKDNFFKVNFSLCCYDNNNYNINAFKNIIYKEDSNNNNQYKEINNFLYLKYFLNIKKMPEKLYKKLIKIDDKNYIVFFTSKKQLNDLNIQNKDNCINKIKEKFNTNPDILNDYKIEDISEKEKIVFIFDIKRPSFDKRKYFEKMNIIIDKFVITTMKNIAYEHHFKAINHTGDGFIMIYQGENLEVDFNNILNSLETIKKDIFDFFESLIDVYKEYRIRGIISKIKIYELKIDNSSYSNTIYMSSDLDGLFKKMKSMKKMEEEYFYNPKNEDKKFFIIIDMENELNLNKDSILNIKICGI